MEATRPLAETGGGEPRAAPPPTEDAMCAYICQNARIVDVETGYEILRFVTMRHGEAPLRFGMKGRGGDPYVDLRQLPYDTLRSVYDIVSARRAALDTPR